MKKIMASILVGILCILNVTPINAQQNNTYGQEDILYKERAKLCIDYDKNRKEIEEIDKRLETLGVEEIPEEEVVEILKEVENYSLEEIPALMIAVPRENGVKWTSSRRISIYNGKKYEIQELRAIPSSANSSLQTTTSTVTKSATGVTARRNLAKIFVTSVLGNIPGVGGELSTGITIYQALKGLYNDLKETETINNIKASYVHRLGVEYTLVFVKPYGMPDAGNQVLCYAGNNIQVNANITLPTFSYDGKTFSTGLKTQTYKGTVTSPNYDGNRWNTACANYVAYKNGKQMEPHYNISTYQEVVVDGTKISIFVPRPAYGF